MDAKLRELHRAAKAGDAEDKARYLQELVRGGLPRRRVYLAAQLGMPEAILLTPAVDLGYFSEGVAAEDVLYRSIRELSGPETQEFLRQYLLKITKARHGTFLSEDKRWLRGYLKKGTWPTDLTRVLTLSNDYAFHLGTLVFYWYQPPQYRVEGYAVMSEASRLARALAHPWHGHPPSTVEAMGNFLLYRNIDGV